MSKSKKLYVVARLDKFAIDHDVIEGNCRGLLKMKHIYETSEEANSEVERLNRVNADKDVYYFWQSAKHDVLEQEHS